MRSAALDLGSYDTDKTASGYLREYDRLFAELVDQPIRLLELGVRTGGSLQLWRDYFPAAHIVGIDIEPPPGLDLGERVTILRGRQEDAAFLRAMARTHAPQGFDVIIDDASHYAALTRAAFDALFDDHLRPGGLYVIEDWGTGYFEDWPDGRLLHPPASALAGRLAALLPWRRNRLPSHDHGMVGLVKQLVDEQGAGDATRRRLHRPDPDARPSRFASMTVYPGMVAVRKRAAD
jgi:SAM-dependent methyltransferase